MNLSPKLKYELHSALNTVIAAMLLELGLQVSMHQELLDPTMITRQLIFAVLMALVRAAWKASFMSLLKTYGVDVPVEPKK